METTVQIETKVGSGKLASFNNGACCGSSVVVRDVETLVTVQEGIRAEDLIKAAMDLISVNNSEIPDKYNQKARESLERAQNAISYGDGESAKKFCESAMGSLNNRKRSREARAVKGSVSP